MVDALVLAKPANGLVVFAYNSGLSRFSLRNRQVARSPYDRRCGTPLPDLLRREEERDRTNVFDIRLRSERLLAARRCAPTRPESVEPQVGYFGASIRAGAALRAAALLGDQLGAAVSRGARPDLAGPVLSNVAARVPLIVGKHDELVPEPGREARSHLRTPSELAVVPGAPRRFEEQGGPEEVSRVAGDRFGRRVAPVEEEAA